MNGDPTHPVMRALVASRLDEVGPGGGRWRWRFDALLVASVLSGRHFDLVVRAVGYSPRRCTARVRRILPPVLHRDAKAAVLAELRRRAQAEVEP